MQNARLDELQDAAYRHYQAGDKATAIRLLQQLLAEDPNRAAGIYLLGGIAHDAGQMEQALVHYRRAVEVAPDNAVFQNALGEALDAQGRREEGQRCFERAISLRPTYERAHNNLGRAMHAAGNLPAARASFSEAVRLNPRYVIAQNNLGAALQAMGELDAAAARFREALKLKPDYPEAFYNLGTVLQARGDPLGAAELFQQAVKLRPNYARAHYQLGQSLQALRQDYDALAAYEKAAQLQPNEPDMQRQLGDLLMIKGDWPPALKCLERAAELQPGKAEPFAHLFYGRQLVCDWRKYDAGLQRLWSDVEAVVATGEPSPVTPFQAITLPWTLPQLYTVAKSFCDVVLKHKQERGIPSPRQDFPRTRSGRLKIGYLSGDFNDHPISHLIHGMFGRHDRGQFEIFAYAFGKRDESNYRQRITAECEHFVDVSALSLPGLANQIADDGIHILIDLMGHTGINRLGAIALRPAPIQVNFLGMLGTIGANFIDYLVTDATITPPEFAPHFAEKFVTMPHSYLIAEPEPTLPAGPVKRSDHGLPEEGFVFCSFNSSYKIEPRTFGIWMRLLAQVPRSVLWLFTNGPVQQEYLSREASSHGVGPERLVFTSYIPRPEHMARHRAADLFLDTLNYNGAATASLALQMGLPVLTCLGQTFASRIGASLLKSMGLPELIASSPEEYEAMAVRLAVNPDELAKIRQKLAEARSTSPLFDTARFVRNLERGYLAMWDVHAGGRPPEPITIIE